MRVTAHPEVNASATLNSASGGGSQKTSDEQPVTRAQSARWCKLARTRLLDKLARLVGAAAPLFWFFHLMQKLLEGDRPTLGLMGRNPFPDLPPRYIRAEYCRYTFTTPDERKATGRWWNRVLVGTYLRPVSLDDPAFHSLLLQQGWL